MRLTRIMQGSPDRIVTLLRTERTMHAADGGPTVSTCFDRPTSDSFTQLTQAVLHDKMRICELTAADASVAGQLAHWVTLTTGKWYHWLTAAVNHLIVQPVIRTSAAQASEASEVWCNRDYL